MTPADKARFHSDPANWKLGIFYFCRADPRILVPKRLLGLGSTLNLARPMAIPFFLSLLALIPCASALARYLGAGSDVRFAVKVIVVLGIIALCHRLTHRSAGITGSESDSKPGVP